MKTSSGGGSEIEVHTEPVEVPEGQEGDEQPEGYSDEATAAVNEALVETVVRVLGKTIATITKIPEMDFDDVETEQLKTLWSPYVPALSPKAMAILGTVVIVGGKVGVYMANRPKKPTDTTVESKGVQKQAGTLEQQLEQEWKRD